MIPKYLHHFVTPLEPGVIATIKDFVSVITQGQSRDINRSLDRLMGNLSQIFKLVFITIVDHVSSSSNCKSAVLVLVIDWLIADILSFNFFVFSLLT